MEEFGTATVVVAVECTNRAAQEFATVDSYHDRKSYMAVGLR